MLERAGISPPPVVICGDETVRGKPDPECFLRAAEALNATPAECTVVEDAPAGINAALAAGMAPIAVATTHAPEQLVGAKRVFPSLLAASSYLLSLAEDRGE
jgi:sugar-phosphatase